MNLKLRFQNKATVAAIIAIILAAVYQILLLLGAVTPEIWGQIISIVLIVLGGFGIIIDPTTVGIGDSDLALSKTNLERDTTLKDMPSGAVLYEDETASQIPEPDIAEEELSKVIVQDGE